MRAVAVVALVVFTVALSEAAVLRDYPKCAYGDNGGEPVVPNPPLSMCADMFPQETCCNSTQTDQLKQGYDHQITPVFSSCPNCVINFKNVLCNYICSPYQGQFVNFYGWTKSGPKTDLYVCPDTCTAFYNSCGDVSLGGIAVKTLFKNPQAFCKYSTYTQPVNWIFPDPSQHACVTVDNQPNTCKS